MRASPRKHRRGISRTFWHVVFVLSLACLFQRPPPRHSCRQMRKELRRITCVWGIYIRLVDCVSFSRYWWYGRTTACTINTHTRIASDHGSLGALQEGRTQPAGLGFPPQADLRGAAVGYGQQDGLQHHQVSRFSRPQRQKLPAAGKQPTVAVAVRRTNGCTSTDRSLAVHLHETLPFEGEAEKNAVERSAPVVPREDRSPAVDWTDSTEPHIICWPIRILFEHPSRSPRI